MDVDENVIYYHHKVNIYFVNNSKFEIEIFLVYTVDN